MYFQLLSHKESLHLVRLDSESTFGFYTILNATVERVPLHASPTFCPAVLYRWSKEKKEEGAVETEIPEPKVLPTVDFYGPLKLPK